MQTVASNRQMSDTTGPSEIARRLNAALVAHGLSRQRVEREAGFSVGYLSRFLNGDRQSLSADRIARVAAVAGVRVEWLLSGVGPRDLTSPAPSTDVPPREPRRDAPPGPLARALMQAVDANRHELEDVDVTRAALAGVDFNTRESADLVAAARRWLDAAARLRRRGVEVTPGALLAEATLAPAAEERSRAANEAGDAAARELGAEPGSAADAVKQALVRKKRPSSV